MIINFTLGDRVKKRNQIVLLSSHRMRKYPEIDDRFDRTGSNNFYADYIDVEYVKGNAIEDFFVIGTISYQDENADEQSCIRCRIYVVLQAPISLDDFLDTTPGFVLQRPWRKWTVVGYWGDDNTTTINLNQFIKQLKNGERETPAPDRAAILGHLLDTLVPKEDNKNIKILGITSEGEYYFYYINYLFPPGDYGDYGLKGMDEDKYYFSKFTTRDKFYTHYYRIEKAPGMYGSKVGFRMMQHSLEV